MLMWVLFKSWWAMKGKRSLCSGPLQSTRRLMPCWLHLPHQVTKLHHDLEEAIHTNTQLLADSSARQVDLRAKEDELAGLRVEILKVIKVWCVPHMPHVTCKVHSA